MTDPKPDTDRVKRVLSDPKLTKTAKTIADAADKKGPGK